MAQVSVRDLRDLRDHGGDVLARVERGEVITVTRAGTPVAQLTALPRPRSTAAELVERRRHPPVVDPELLRRDVDTLVEQFL